MKTWLLLILLCTGQPVPVRAEVEPVVPPPLQEDVLMGRYLRGLQRTIRNFSILTAHPNGNRQGHQGDVVLYNDGFSLRTCINTSPQAGGGMLWSCQATGSDTRLCFEGSGTDDFETCFIITNPTADRTITVPDADAEFLAFDSTVPITQNYADTAATGSATAPARRDHVHGMPQFPAWVFVETLSLSGTSTSSSTLPTDADQFLVVFDEATDSGSTVGIRLGAGAVDTGNNYEYTQIDVATVSVVSAASNVLLGRSAGDPITGTASFSRPAVSGQHAISCDIGTSDDADEFCLNGNWNNTGTVTVFAIVGGAGLGGKAHLYKLTKT